MEKEQQLRDYLQKNVNPVFERLIVDLLIETPQDFISFSINWLNTKGRQIQSGQIVERPKSGFTPNITVKETPNFDFNPMKNVEPQQSDEEKEEDDQVMAEEEFKGLQQKKQNQPGMRTSVSAEVYGKFNKKGDFKAKVVPKNEDQKQRITKRLLQSFMFSALDDKDRDIVINAMEEKKFAKGETVIKQGDDGDVLFLVDEGELDCFKVFKKEDGEKFLKVYAPGDAFGELALLYNAPRAATIRAKTDSICFTLDRECFNNIVKESSIKRRERYEKTLEKVDLLSSMEPYERTQLCDGIKEQKFQAGEVIIKEGEKGDKFYMVDEGQLIATKTIKGQGEAPVQVMEYKEGDYFGELALVRDIPRQANVVAKTSGVLVYLDHGAFKRLMGPMEQLLKRNEEKYAKYWKAEDLKGQV